MNFYFVLKVMISLSILVVISLKLEAQISNSNTAANDFKINNTIIAVPFLLITPDARSSAMGEAGVAVLPDINSMSINPSKIAFINQQSGLALSYVPWLGKLVSGINLGYLSGFYKLDNSNVIGASIRYFSLGKIELIDINKYGTGFYSPNEFSIDGTFSKRFGDSFSLGTTLRYIHSDLATSQFTDGQQTRVSYAIAMDISAYLKKQTQLLGTDVILAFGTSISNIGTKMSYTDNGNKYFLPTNLKLGSSSTLLIDDLSQFTIAVDFNKLLIPNSFNSQIKEINISTGLEYLYQERFALRIGYGRYLTTGIGFTHQFLTLDFAYLIGDQQKNPLANSLRFTLLFNLKRPHYNRLNE